MKVKVMARTFEDIPGAFNENSFSPESIRKDLTLLSGKAAGFCYMADDYLSNGIQNDEKSMARAQGNAKSGHYSTYEHGHVTFLIETTKAMCMILNSMGLYSTSEKSGRYTSMNPETEIEKEMYEKWKGIFTELICVYYKDVYTESQMAKLAMENARYMISVFAPTTLIHTLPFNRAVLMCDWLDVFAENVCKYYGALSSHLTDNIISFYTRLAIECKDLATELRAALGITKSDHLLDDHKIIGIELFSEISAMYKLSNIDSTISRIHELRQLTEKHSYYGDNYISNYKCSFTTLAQEHRHRTIHYSISIPDVLEVYVPKIIRGTRYELPWRHDFEALVSQGVMPQGTIINVCEQGRFEDFVLKAKERLCARAQLEIMEITRDQVAKFAINRSSLSLVNCKVVSDMIANPDKNFSDFSDVIVKSRCQYSNYSCKEPCKVLNTYVNYYRNV